MKLNINSKCSDELLKNVIAFQDAREEAYFMLIKTLKQLEKTQGSEYYEEKCTEAKKKYFDTVQDLLRLYSERVERWISEMHEVNNKRSIMPPTEEDMRILSIVKERVNQGVKEDELDMLYNSLSDSPEVATLFNEYATKAGVFKSYRGNNQPIPIRTINDTIDTLARGISDYMQNDTDTRIGRIIDSRADRFGTIQEKPRWGRFTDKAGMFQTVYPSFNVDNIEAFCECCD